MTKVYVTATDKFMSGWGRAENKINKLVIECDNYDEASLVHDKLLNRGEMKYVNIRMSKPYYDKNNYYTSFIDKSDELSMHWYR